VSKRRARFLFEHRAVGGTLDTSDRAPRWPDASAFIREPVMKAFQTPLDPPPKVRPLRFRPARRRPDLTVEQILTWCDAFRDRVGHWPTPADRGRGLPDTTWCPGHVPEERSPWSVPRLLAGPTAVPTPGAAASPLPLPTHPDADPLGGGRASRPHRGLAHSGFRPDHRRAPGVVVEGESRAARGASGLARRQLAAPTAPGSTGVRTIAALPRLQSQEILFWAEAHHDRTRAWPTRMSGPIPEAPGENWHAVDSALKSGGRGLPGGDSLSRLLDRRCRTPPRARR
jgi:hypothetical protein